MKKSLLIIFLLLIILPIMVIVWMSYSDYIKSRDTAIERYRILAGDRLRDIDRLIHSYLENMEITLRSYQNADMLSIDELRKITRNTSIIKQLFIINKDKKFVFPPEDGEISNRESDFLTRAKEFEFVNIPGIQPVESAADISYKTGWYTWFMGDGINFIFKQTGRTGNIIGIELNRTALLSGIISALPESEITRADDTSDRIVVTDARGGTLYQWGLFSPADNAVPLTAIRLSEPLGAWRLSIFIDIESDNSALFSARYLFLYSGLAVLVLVITGLAVYFYRENTRAIRDARNKVSFVNQVSHEFKTPLTNISLYAELLAPRLKKKKEVEHLGIILSESGRLSRMINNVLTFSRSENGTLILNPENIIVDDIIRKVITLFTPMFDAKSFEVVTVYNAPSPVYIDADIVRQILTNLISNTEKYASNGKYIKIESEQNSEKTAITVSDKGPGVPFNKRNKIFDSFYRLEDKLSEGVSGTGIGLTIAENLAEKCGGKLYLVKSEIGAVFRFEIKNEVNCESINS